MFVVVLVVIQVHCKHFYLFSWLLYLFCLFHAIFTAWHFYDKYIFYAFYTIYVQNWCNFSYQMSVFWCGKIWVNFCPVIKLYKGGYQLGRVHVWRREYLPPGGV